MDVLRLEAQVTKEERDWRLLKTAEDVTPEIKAHVEACLDWFEDEPSLNTEEFIDRLCKTYLNGDGYGEEDCDLDSYENEAARKIMRIARQMRKEQRS